ncbi:MAG TPA: hypothetical protein VGD10_08310 [Allosphingosinicella sp.]|uniref:hypothetical protein n=1 Tax=Allosphingosinicella sp. TaxID=2823234 RepID=UPI002ED99D0E
MVVSEPHAGAAVVKVGRRAASLICYLLAGLLMPVEIAFAFADFDYLGREIFLWMTLGPILLLLLIGAALSPGRGPREIGLTLLISTSLGLIALGALGYAVFESAGRIFADDQSAQAFGNHSMGAANIVALLTAGLLLFGRRPTERIVGEATATESEFERRIKAHKPGEPFVWEQNIELSTDDWRWKLLRFLLKDGKSYRWTFGDPTALKSFKADAEIGSEPTLSKHGAKGDIQ